MSSNTHFFENFSLNDNSSESIMANCAFMESPSNQPYPSFPNFVQSTSQEASPNFFLGGATQSYDAFNPYQDSTTHDYFKDQIGLYASSPLESNDLLEPAKHQPEVTQMPSSMLENHKKAKGQKKEKNVEPNGGVNICWREKAVNRCPWSKSEDRLLVQLVEQYGDKSWARIAEKLPLRIGKQCRERWHNCLKPNITNNEWSEEDDKLLVALHKQFGNKWADIARNMPGRSENSIKNHWNATKRKQFKYSFKDHKKIKHQSYLLKDYITSVSSLSSDNQSNIQENLGFDPQDHESMSLNAWSSSFSGSGLGYKPDELMEKEADFDFDEVSSYLIDQLQFDPPNEMDYIGSIFGNQVDIQESLGFDPQNDEPMMSLNARSSLFSGCELGYASDELLVKEADFDFDALSLG